MRTLAALLTPLLLVVAINGCTDQRRIRDPYASSGNSASPVEGYGSASTTTIYSSTPSSQPNPTRSHASPASAAAPSPAPEPPAPAVVGEERASEPREVRETSSPSSEKASAGSPSAPRDPARVEGKTAGDQGNSADEVKITAAIRRALVTSTMLSFSAKNAKVITNGTKVTLRGTVKTEAERGEIERLARATAGVTEVDNQLVAGK